MEASNIRTRRKRSSGVLSSCSSGLHLVHNVRLLLIHIILCQTISSASGTLNYTKYRQVGSLRLARIQKHLDAINKPPVLTIQSPDGDIIDCVPKRKQPALDHPLLKNHKIQRVRPEMPKRMKESVNVTNSRGLKGAWQAWHQNKERCPKGSVPIRRSHVHDILRANSVYDFGKKRHAFSGSRLPMAGRHPDALDVVSGNGHEADAKTILNAGGSVEAANKIVRGDKKHNTNWLLGRLIKKKEPKEKSATSTTYGASDQYVADLTTRIGDELTKEMDEKVDRMVLEMKKLAEKWCWQNSYMV